MDYNAADTRQIRKAAKAAKQAEAERRSVIFILMSSPPGRSYVWDQLERCHCFASSFASDALAMAFAEGERNIGLQLLNDIMAFAPDQYIQMTREANDRRIAGDRDTSGRSPEPGRDAVGPEQGDSRVERDWDPGDEDRAED